MISWLENLYVLADRFFKSSSNFFSNSYYNKNIFIYHIILQLLYHLQRSHNNNTCNIVLLHASHFLLSCSYLDLILWIPSARLSARSDNDMVFVVSLPFLLILFISFVIGAEKIIYFSLFSPRPLNSPSNSWLQNLLAF